MRVRKGSCLLLSPCHKEEAKAQKACGTCLSLKAYAWGPTLGLTLPSALGPFFIASLPAVDLCLPGKPYRTV